MSRNNLKWAVIEASESDVWEDAVEEWDIIDCEEDFQQKSTCICGQDKLIYLYTIRNRCNGNVLFPIGSTCIQKFGRTDLDEIISVKEQMFHLVHAMEQGRYIELNSELFSRKLLRFMYEDGAFQATKYNGFDGFHDYEFMLNMFNKSGRGGISQKQERKVKAIIMNSIKPYLQKQLHR